MNYTAPILAFFISACTVPQARVLRAGPAEAAPLVVVLEGPKNDLAQSVLEHFLETIEARVVAYPDIDQVNKATLAQEIRRVAPQLVFAMGTPSAVFMRDTLPDIPTLFTMVLNYRAQGLQASAKLMGIAMETALISNFTQFKMVVPGLRRVLMPYTAAKSEYLAQEALATLPSLDISPVPVPVDDGAPFPRLAELLGDQRVDGVWIPSDVWVMRNARRLIEEADAQNLPVLGSVAAGLVRFGALAVVAVDIPSLGTQAATLANAWLTHESDSADIGIQTPIGTRLSVNLDTAKRENIEIPVHIMSFIGETYSKTAP